MPIGIYIIGKKRTMMTERMTYRWLWSCLIAGGLLLLTGCADSFEEVQQPSPVPQPEEESHLELHAITRTSDAYIIPNAENPASSVQLFLYTLTPTNDDPNLYTGTEGTFSYNNNQWSPATAITVKEETQYYMYGYMPGTLGSSVSVEAADLNGDYSKGIDLTLSNLPAITLDDISVLVGVQRVGSTTTAESPDVKEGQYGFRSGIKGENFVNLLMAHLYAKLKLSFKIDPDYAELRSIHIKKVKLTSRYTDGASVTVNLRDGKGIGNPTFPSASEGTDEQDEHNVTIFESSSTVPQKVLDKALVTLENPFLTLDIPAYCRPIAVEKGKTYNLTLTTTYDVYDTAGENLGERTSVNKIKFSMANVRPGNENNIVLTVKPTYLYILSDNDLDNPVIDVGS